MTDDRPAALGRAATALGVPVEVAEDSPYVLVGTAEEIAAELVRHHDRLGLSRWTVFADRPDLQPAEALVPVLAKREIDEQEREEV